MTEYVLDKGRGVGVQQKKEGPIMEDDKPADLDSILDRIAPEKREAFLRSRAKLMDKGDAELLGIALHLDNFAAVVDGLTIGLSPRSENARDIDTARKEVQALTEAVRSAGDGVNALAARCKVLDDAVAVFHGVARSRLWWIIALAFVSGAVVGWATFFIKF
jgi:hypothetical protein